MSVLICDTKVAAIVALDKLDTRLRRSPPQARSAPMTVRTV